MIKNRSRTNNNFIYVILIGILTTLYLNPNVQDPINSPKLWILTLSIPISFSFFVTHLKKLSDVKIEFYLILFFLCSQIIAFLFTENLYVGFFGDSQRKNGLLTYFALGLIWLLTVATYSHYKNSQVKKYIIIMSLILGFYGFLQSLGKDFIKWQNPYNQVILTVGNPNFSAALLAMLICFIFPNLFSKLRNKNRLLNLVSLFLLWSLLLYVMLKTEAKQGILASAAGLIASLYFLYFNKNKNRKFLYCVASVTILFFSVLGMLQKGPLSSFLYKDSVSVRGYYWRAAVKMFESKPVVGVGLDSYLYYFKQFREVGYPLKYGYQITSSNAHNVYLQFFATGGMLLGITYLIIIIYTFIQAIKAIKDSDGVNQLFLIGIFSSWIAFLAQSLISIDNLGNSIWGWIFSGILIGAAKETGPNQFLNDKKVKKIQGLEVFRSFTALILLIPTIFLVSKMYWSERTVYVTRGMIGSGQIDQQFLERVLNDNLVDSNYKVLIASDLFRGNNRNIAIEILKKQVKSNPRNDDALNSLAYVFESSNDYKSAIPLRESLVKLDPWGAANLLQLGRDYKATGNLGSMQLVRNQILKFAANTEIGKLAVSELA